MKQIGIFEGKSQFSALVERARNGETILITKNGDAVAQIGPPRASQEVNSRAAKAMKRILSSKATLGGVPLRELIDEGRRY